MSDFCINICDLGSKHPYLRIDLSLCFSWFIVCIIPESFSFEFIDSISEPRLNLVHFCRFTLDSSFAWICCEFSELLFCCLDERFHGRIKCYRWSTKIISSFCCLKFPEKMTESICCTHSCFPSKSLHNSFEFSVFSIFECTDSTRESSHRIDKWFSHCLTFCYRFLKRSSCSTLGIILSTVFFE